MAHFELKGIALYSTKICHRASSSKIKEPKRMVFRVERDAFSHCVLCDFHLTGNMRKHRAEQAKQGNRPPIGWKHSSMKTFSRAQLRGKAMLERLLKAIFFRKICRSSVPNNASLCIVGPLFSVIRLLLFLFICNGVHFRSPIIRAIPIKLIKIAPHYFQLIDYLRSASFSGTFPTTSGAVRLARLQRPLNIAKNCDRSKSPWLWQPTFFSRQGFLGESVDLAYLWNCLSCCPPVRVEIAVLD